MGIAGPLVDTEPIGSLSATILSLETIIRPGKTIVWHVYVDFDGITENGIIFISLDKSQITISYLMYD